MSTPEKTLEKLVASKMIPVVRTSSAANANKIIELLVEAGAKAIEVTLTIPDALSVIKKWSGNMFVGAGTVLSAKDAEAALAAGAQFLVAPGFDKATLDYARSKKVLYVPGILTPTEVMNAQAQGVSLVKVFPASVMGGEKYIKALSRVFPKMSWMVTGGVNIDNMKSISKTGAILGVGESMMPEDLVERGDWSNLKVLIQEYYQNL
jgi:2-dehydro-3-deoxyphosphogluconate aldolase / (4S)-4-hydroxy-2-oxoglutarate aldolase